MLEVDGVYVDKYMAISDVEDYGLFHFLRQPVLFSTG